MPKVAISGQLYDKLARTTQNVLLIGEVTELTDPPVEPPDTKPPWWPGAPTHPIVPRPEHPIVLPDPPIEPPIGEPDDDGFIKAPPPDGGWGYHKDYGWMWYPGPGGAGPKG